MSKSGTQGLSFLRVRYANLKPHTEHWFTICLAPVTSIITATLPDETRRKLKLQLYHCFIFTLFRRLVRASYTGIVFNATTYSPRISMVVADQPEERSLLALKRRDSDMECSHCTLRTRLREEQSCSGTLSAPSSSSDNESSHTPRRRVMSRRNTDGDLSSVRLPERDPIRTVRHQLDITIHNKTRHLPPSELLRARRHLIEHSAHELPPVLACFAGLGSIPCNLYRVVTFSKLHVLDLVIIRPFCDLCNTVLARTSPLPLSRTMAIANIRFSTLPHLAVFLVTVRLD